MSISIRSERPGEEDLIDEVECRAFGSMNEARELKYPHHNPRFDIDESVLPLGVALLAAATARKLR